MTRSIARKAPAKLNLTLEVLARRADGYHDIRSVFLRRDRLADLITVSIDKTRSGIRTDSDSRAIPSDATNICHRAAVRYLAETKLTAAVDVRIEKTIPVAAGLGGGSSDAAAVLLALNRHFDARLSPRQLATLGRDLGSDVPFFLQRARAAQVSGIGEIVEPLPLLPGVRFLVVNPGVWVSTREAFQALDDELWFMAHTRRANVTAAMANAIATRDIRRIAAGLHNDFEIVIERRHPIVKELKHALRAFGAAGASMSGSGPTVFGLFDSNRVLVNAEDALRTRYPAFVIARA